VVPCNPDADADEGLLTPKARSLNPSRAVQALQRNFLYSFTKPTRSALAMASEFSSVLSALTSSHFIFSTTDP
jgi:hypothetical protein